MSAETKIIMGIDPGLASTGVGLISVKDGKELGFLHADSVVTSTSLPMPERLEKISSLIRSTIKKYQPMVVAVESIFFAKNVRSAVMMAHGRGAAILSVYHADVAVEEYSPLEIKQSVVGKGRASKDQVKQMVSILLDLKKAPRNDHESDALAIAIAHAFRSSSKQLSVRNPKPDSVVPASSAQETPKSDQKYYERKDLLALTKKRKRSRKR